MNGPNFTTPALLLSRTRRLDESYVGRDPLSSCDISDPRTGVHGGCLLILLRPVERSMVVGSGPMISVSHVVVVGILISTDHPARGGWASCALGSDAA